jgi:hypothetical protein
VPDLQTAHTADLDPGVLAAALALLDDVFDDMTEQGWGHSLGRIHALARSDGEEDCIYVLPVSVPLSGELSCDWRDGEVW